MCLDILAISYNHQWHISCGIVSFLVSETIRTLSLCCSKVALLMGLVGTDNTPHSSGLSPYDYFLSVWVKDPHWGCQFESADAISEAVTASLYHQSKDDYSTVIDCMPHCWEKCVDLNDDTVIKGQMQLCYDVSFLVFCCVCSMY
jgi:hypothetical protein